MNPSSWIIITNPRKHRQTILFGLIIFPMMLLMLLPRSAPAGDLRSLSFDSAETLYVSGHPQHAIELWQHELRSLRHDGDPLRVLQFAGDLAERCTLARDSRCMFDIFKAIDGIDLRTGEPNRVHHLFLLHGYILDLFALHFGTTAQVQMALEMKQVGAPEWLLGDPALYIARQFLQSQMWLALENHDESGLALEKGLLALAALEVSSQDAQKYAYLLATAIDIHVRAGHLVEADGLMRVAAPFLYTQTSQGSLEFALFKAVEAEVLFATGRLAEASVAAQTAINTFLALDMPASVFADRRIVLYAIQAGACGLVTIDAACVDEKLALIRDEEKHYGGQAKSEEPGHFDAYVTAIEVLARGVVGSLELSDPRWRDRAWAVLNGKWRFDVDPELDSARSLAIALLSAEGPDHDFLLHARQAILTLRSTTSQTHVNQAGMTFEPGLYRKFIAIAGAEILTRDRTASGLDAGLVLHAVEYATRGVHFRQSDALAEIAGAKSSRARRSVHMVARLRSKQSHTVRELIAQQIALLQHTSVGEAHASPLINNDLHWQLADMAINRRTASESLRNDHEHRELPLIPSLDDIQSYLEADEALLVLGSAPGDNMISICITRESATAIQYPIDTQELQSDINTLNRALVAEHRPGLVSDSEYPVSEAVRIYDATLAPRLRGPNRCLNEGMTVFVAPSNTFAKAPLGVTLSAEPHKDQFGWLLGSAPWALRNNSFVYIYSVRGFLAQRRILELPRISSGKLLSIADPVLDGSSAAGTEAIAAITRRASPRIAQDGLAALARIPNTASEAEAVFHALGRRGTLVVGEAATEAAFRTDILSQYQYLHFATHGLLRNEGEALGEAALVLSPVSQDNAWNDGLLTASEIADLSLNADIAVLSACNTANVDSEYFYSEIQGLTTAFSTAGVPAVLATLWPVETFASEELVTTFFQHFTTGKLSAAQALRKAKLDFLETSRRPLHHPRHWGAFVMLGDVVRTTALDERSSNLTVFSGNGSVLDAAKIEYSDDFLLTIDTDRPALHHFAPSFTPIATIKDLRPRGLARTEDGGTYAFGTRSLGAGAPPEPMILEFSSADESLAAEEVPLQVKFGAVVSMTSGVDRSLATLIAQAVISEADSKSEGEIRFILEMIGATGDSPAPRRLPFATNGYRTSAAGIRFSDEYLLVFVTPPRTDVGQWEPALTTFQTLTRCSEPLSTNLAWLSTDGQTLMAHSTLENVAIDDVIATRDGRFIFVGREAQECGLDDILVLGELEPETEGWQKYMLDNTPGYTTSARLALDANGSVLAVATRARHQGLITKGPEDLARRAHNHSAPQPRSRISEAHIICITPDSIVREMLPLTGGADLHVTALDFHNSMAILGGRLGIAPFVYKFASPCQ